MRDQVLAKQEPTVYTHSLVKFKKYDELDDSVQEWEKFLP